MKKSVFLCLVSFLLSLAVLDAPRLYSGQVPVLDKGAKQRIGATAGSGGLQTARAEKSASQGRAAASPAAGDPSLRKISSRSAIVIDAETGETLFAKDADTPRQPASTIKVLTGMIALKSLDELEWVPVSRRASDMPRSKVYLDPNKSYRANDLINAVLLASANDASVALAERIAGSEQDFAEMMTLRASLWGAKNTVCRTATGLTAKGQQSTARDLALIFRHAMQDEQFASRMHRVKTRTSYGKELHNHNKALWRVEGAEGGKTGYTSAARQTYVGQFTREGVGTIVVALMGSESMWSDVENLVDYGFAKQKRVKTAAMGLQGNKVALAE
ncbi:MAG: D-alanyl-D-alanine carboxypeptidase family protein [Desulfobulbaceae bacterium]|jgi:D-alanyl-D-alanine carboxypeptidase (penicillin-binding protein 5/6)|nr:D-alanyl-D-alanine carboxypeptidase [Desulfobulbaceae bacterium]MDY0351403.1 D-alanyl-D-alanine carboxypeptidase family protein [Desulfobulbaceae bacterium]